MRRPIRVALVDDHAIVRAGYRRLLELEGDFGWVSESASAEEAYSALVELERQTGRCPVDVLVVDLSMPGRGGLDLLQRASARWPTLALLVFSMHDGPAMVRQALRAGAAGFVTKSAEPEELVRALRRVAVGEREVLSRDVAGHLVPGDAPHERLTPREWAVLQGLLTGDPLEGIAQRLHLSPKTVANHQSAIRQRLGVGSAVELLRYAREHGLEAGAAPKHVTD